MHRLKTVLAVLLSLVLLAGLALLPKGIAGISDFLTNEKPGTASIHAVELSVYSDQTDEPGYMMRKLALEQRMTTIPIEPEQATMTEEEVLNAALEGMVAYEDANVFEWFEYTFFSAEPYLGMDPENQNNNSIFWGVQFTREEKPYQNLFLHIDDETGRILYLSYETYGPDADKYYEPENQRLMMEGFVDAFFRPLKLTASEMSEYKNFIGTEISEKETPDDETIVSYTYEDAIYGAVHVTFHISPEGLHVFPGEIRS